MAFTNRISGWRIARRQSEIILDSDAFEARVSWASDTVALTGMVLSGLSIALLEVAHRRATGVLMLTALLIAGIGCALLSYIIVYSGRLMNGYPESLYSIFPVMVRLSRRAPFLLPGLVLSVIGGVLLGIVAASSST